MRKELQEVWKMSSSVISPFNLLLNSISNDLSPQNLVSLVHICERFIPESKREEIKNGIDVFRILKQQNVIGEDFEKAKNLKKIMKEMRPKRKDINERVKYFIRTNYHPNHDTLSSVDSFDFCRPAAVVDTNHQPSSLDSPGMESGFTGIRRGFSSVEIRPSNTDPHCSMDCCCWGCNCYARQIPSCLLVFMTSIMALLTLLSTVFWYEKIPKNLYRELGPDGIKAGGYFVGCFGVATIAFLVWWIYRKVGGNSHFGQIPYQGFANDDRMSPCSKIAVKGSTNTPASVELPMKKQKRRPFGSVNAGMSLDTVASVSILNEEPRQIRIASRKLSRRSRRHGRSKMEDGRPQTDGDYSSGERDESFRRQSKESLVTT